MENSQLWNIYGKKYDLTNFIKNHPGGAFILESTRGQKDITPLFESYHSFSDIYNIKTILNKYEVKPEDSVEPYTKYDFTKYNELSILVKEQFPTVESVKAPTIWWIFTAILFSSYASLFYFLIFAKMYLVCKILLSIATATFEMAFAFNFLHDGSHYAIVKNPEINVLISKIVNSFFLWNSKIWNLHHVIQHHSVTGLKDDPDEFIYGIFNSAKYILFVYGFIPGQQLAQVIFYMGGYYTKNNPITNGYYDITDILIMMAKIYCFYSIGLIPSIFYVSTLNVLYFTNIYPNHELYETKVLNHYEGDDWLKLQICNSGNFLNNNALWSSWFGGINYQIEHHLFPSMSNSHYSAVSKIVRKYCADNDIPYVHKETLYDCYISFMKNLNSQKQSIIKEE